MEYRSTALKASRIGASTHEWGEALPIAGNAAYSAKLLHYKAGRSAGLLYHAFKTETFYLHSGEAWVDQDSGGGTLERIRMTAGMIFDVPPGAVHRFEAITDCVVFEVSTTRANDSIRMEDHYGVR